MEFGSVTETHGGETAKISIVKTLQSGCPSARVMARSCARPARGVLVSRDCPPLCPGVRPAAEDESLPTAPVDPATWSTHDRALRRRSFPRAAREWTARQRIFSSTPAARSRFLARVQRALFPTCHGPVENDFDGAALCAPSAGEFARRGSEGTRCLRRESSPVLAERVAASSNFLKFGGGAPD